MSAMLSLMLAVAAGAAGTPQYEIEVAKKQGAVGQPVLAVEITLSAKAPTEARARAKAAIEKAGGHLAMGGAPTDAIFFFPALPLREQRAKMTKAVESLEALGSLHGRSERLNPTLGQREEETGKQKAALVEERSKLGEGLKSAPTVAALIEGELARLWGLDYEAEQRQGALILHVDAGEKKGAADKKEAGPKKGSKKP